jgi:hypothetical protein
MLFFPEANKSIEILQPRDEAEACTSDAALWLMAGP